MGLVKKVLTPLIKAGTSGSRPLAFETIALSTIEMAGATASHNQTRACEKRKFSILPTDNAERMAADASAAMRIGKGEMSSDPWAVIVLVEVEIMQT